jgi:integrase
MSSVRFNLDKGRIFLIYHYGPNDKVKLYLKEKCDPKDWDVKRNRMKDGRGNSNYVNSLLSKIVEYIDAIRLQNKIDGKLLTAKTIKYAVYTRIFGDSSKLQIYDYSKIWLKEKLISSGYRKTLSNLLNVINKIYPDLTWDDISLSWLKDFDKKTIDLSQNYKSNIIKKLRELMDAAYIDGHHTNKVYANSKFLIKTVETDKIALTQHWLDCLYDNLGQMENRHSNASIIFLIGCMTGQRWQDYSLINKGMIFLKGENAFISITQPKTLTRVTIPVSNKLINLLEMNTHKVSQQKFNQYIKEAFRSIGYLEYNKIASHTARRTFATLAVLAGVETYLIMKITGHKSEKTFRLYVKMDDLTAAMKSAASIKEFQDGTNASK